MSLYLIIKGLTKIILIVTTISLISCNSTSKLVYKTKINANKVHYFVTKTSKHRKNENNFYARVDSNNVRIYYNFFEKKIIKTYNNDNNVQYILNFEKQPSSYLTAIDSFVLANAENLMDSLDYKELKRPRGALGFYMEVIRTP